MNKKLSIPEIKEKFSSEFSILKSKFTIIELSISEALNNGTKEVNMPGIYVYWHPAHGVIKVGKSQSNSKKRALEHIRDNTNNSEKTWVNYSLKMKLYYYYLISEVIVIYIGF